VDANLGFFHHNCPHMCERFLTYFATTGAVQARVSLAKGTLRRRGDLSGAVQPWILKLERAKTWASERAAIKAEVTRAKETVDLLRMAEATVRLDALEAEIEAVEKAESGKSSENLRKPRASDFSRILRL
jgi:hypothetical protein